MYPKCDWWIHWGKNDPEPTIYPRCSHWFPGHLAPSDLTVEIREEDEELVVPESPVWDRVSVDEEVDPNDIGDDLREAAIAAPPSDEVVVPTVGGPIIMHLRDGMLGERLRTMGELEMDSDVDVALGEMMPADVQVAPLVEIQDFAAEEEEQARHDRGRADEEANALADRLVREGRAPIPYEEDGGDDALPDAKYNTPLCHSTSSKYTQRARGHN